MTILAINTKKEHIANVPNETFAHIPNKGDYILFKNIWYKVLKRYFQYQENENELEIVNIIVRELRWYETI